MDCKLYRIFPPINGKYYTWNYSEQWLTEQEKTNIEKEYPYRVIPVSLVGIPSGKTMQEYTWVNCKSCQFLSWCIGGKQPVPYCDLIVK